MVTEESTINWFKENDILERVSNNVERCTTERLGTTYTLEHLLDVMFRAKLPIRDFLTMAFDWEIAPGEYTFWEEKNRDFQEWVDSESGTEPANTILEAFVNFLDEEGIKEKFEYNRKNDSVYRISGIRPDATIEAFVNRVCSTDILEPEKLLSYAFRWHDTPEGRDFWNEMDERWISTYSKL